MNSTILAAAAAVLLVVLVLGAGYLNRRKPRRLNVEYYQTKWQSVMKLCGDKATWPLAIIDADKLLDDALRRSKYKGKSMGERLMSAQHEIKDNDAIWTCHKLRNRLVHESDVKLREREVKTSLLAVKATLKDLGALK